MGTVAQAHWHNALLARWRFGDHYPAPPDRPEKRLLLHDATLICVSGMFS